MESAELGVSATDSASNAAEAGGGIDGSGLVQTQSKKQQAVAGWNDISHKVASTFELDLPPSSACVLGVSVVVMMANEAMHFLSRATDGVQGQEFQNAMGALTTLPLPPRCMQLPSVRMKLSGCTRLLMACVASLRQRYWCGLI
jgi:hypothetical protein